MNKKLSLIAGTLLICSAASAQLPVGMSMPYSPSWSGTMMPVNLNNLPVEIPDSLTPVLVNHIGRHGARFLTKKHIVDHLAAAVGDPAEATPAGRNLYDILQRVATATDGRWGMLTPLGIEQERTIALQLDRMLPGFFRSGSVNCIATYVPRCVESMYSFTEELRRLNPGLDINTSSGPAYNTLLRFFDTDKRYAAYLNTGKWRDKYDAYAAATLPTGPARRIVKGNMTTEEEQQFALDVYHVLQALPAMGVQASYSEVMTPGEFQACYDVVNYGKALRRADTAVSDEPGKAARPLLQEIVATTDQVLSDPSAQEELRGIFRFAHAETIMPLFSLMRLPGCTVPADTDAADLGDYWNCSFVAPLGAFLEIILSKGPSGAYYATLVLNGRTVAPTADGSTVTPWRQLAAYWSRL